MVLYNVQMIFEFMSLLPLRYFGAMILFLIKKSFKILKKKVKVLHPPQELSSNTIDDRI